MDSIMSCEKMFFVSNLQASLFFMIMTCNFMMVCSDSSIDGQLDAIKTIVVPNFHQHKILLNAEIDEYCKKNKLESCYLDGMRLNEKQTFYEVFSGYNQHEYSFVIQQELPIQDNKLRNIKKKIRPIIKDMIDCVVIKVQEDENKQLACALLLQQKKEIEKEKSIKVVRKKALKDQKIKQGMLDVIAQEDEMIYHSCQIS